jgi:hypothetical protein
MMSSREWGSGEEGEKGSWGVGEFIRIIEIFNDFAEIVGINHIQPDIGDDDYTLLPHSPTPQLPYSQ